MGKKRHKTPDPVLPVQKAGTHDSFANFAAAIGIGTNNVNTASTYAFNFLTKNRILLEAMYRGSWIVGAAVDVPADDMTQAGIDFQSDMDPGEEEDLMEAIEDLEIWPSMNKVIKWARLYGSCLGLLLIDGQKLDTPLDISTIGEGQFRGILPIDRWQVVPSMGNLIKDMSPQMGMPKYYRSVPDAILPDLGNIHHSRVIRFDAIEMPHYQKTVDTLWGESIIERLNDRLIAFDSTTTGVAQLVYRAYLRTWKIKGLREIVSSGGKAFEGLTKNVEAIRRVQSNEGITMVDLEDEFDTHQFSFAGLDDVLLQFGQQLAGALEIPLVRLFGQSPAGLSATGESDLRTYYDGIRKKQENLLRRPLKKVLEIVSLSTRGESLPDGFKFSFNPLWQMTEKEKAETADISVRAIMTPFEAGVTDAETTLKELRQLSDRTGMFSNITDEAIKEAESLPPTMLTEDPDGEGQGQGQEKPVGEAAVSGEKVREGSKKSSTGSGEDN
jgi:hypothetical protein